jgi:hypothetical protein
LLRLRRSAAQPERAVSVLPLGKHVGFRILRVGRERIQVHANHRDIRPLTCRNHALSCTDVRWPKLLFAYRSPVLHALDVENCGSRDDRWLREPPARSAEPARAHRSSVCPSGSICSVPVAPTRAISPQASSPPVVEARALIEMSSSRVFSLDAPTRRTPGRPLLASKASRRTPRWRSHVQIIPGTSRVEISPPARIENSFSGPRAIS